MRLVQLWTFCRELYLVLVSFWVAWFPAFRIILASLWLIAPWVDGATISHSFEANIWWPSITYWWRDRLVKAVIRTFEPFGFKNTIRPSSEHWMGAEIAVYFGFTDFLILMGVIRVLSEGTAALRCPAKRAGGGIIIPPYLVLPHG